MSSSSSNSSPCAACKIQRRKCTQECVFAPYFPPDNPQRFTYVHRVFGASNVAKLLQDLNSSQREDAVKSLAYEAEARLRDPVYGCVGLISLLHHKLRHLQTELHLAKKELASYIGPHAMLPILQPTPPTRNNTSPFSVFPFNNNNTMPMPPQMVGVPVPVPVPAVEEMMHQQDVLRFKDGGGGGYECGSSGFNQLSTANSVISPSLALGPVDHSYGGHSQIQTHQAEYHHQHALHHQLQSHLMLSPPTHHSQQSFMYQKHPKSESVEARSTALSR